MSTINVSNLNDGTTTVATTNLTNGSAKVYLNYKGTSTNSIRGSFNVSSVTENNNGDYTTNFSSNMNDANYSVTCSQGGNSSNNEVRTPYNGETFNTGNFRVATLLVGTAIQDSTYLCEAVHGDLA